MAEAEETAKEFSDSLRASARDMGVGLYNSYVTPKISGGGRKRSDPSMDYDELEESVEVVKLPSPARGGGGRGPTRSILLGEVPSSGSGSASASPSDLPPPPSSSAADRGNGNGNGGGGKTLEEMLAVPHELERQVTPRTRGASSSAAGAGAASPTMSSTALGSGELLPPLDHPASTDESPPLSSRSSSTGSGSKNRTSSGGRKSPSPLTTSRSSGSGEGRVSALLYHSVKGGGGLGGDGDALDDDEDSPSLPTSGAGTATTATAGTTVPGVVRSSSGERMGGGSAAAGLSASLPPSSSAAAAVDRTPVAAINSSSLIGGTISLVPAPHTPGGASGPTDVANAAAALSQVKIEEGSPAYYALRANEGVKVRRVDKVARKLNAQSIRRAAKMASLRVGFGNRRGKPPRIPTREGEEDGGGGEADDAAADAGGALSMSLPVGLGRVEEEEEYLAGMEAVEATAERDGGVRLSKVGRNMQLAAVAGPGFSVEEFHSAPPALGGPKARDVMGDVVGGGDEAAGAAAAAAGTAALAEKDDLDSTVRKSNTLDRRISEEVSEDLRGEEEEKEEISVGDPDEFAPLVARGSGSSDGAEPQRMSAAAMAAAGTAALFAADKQGGAAPPPSSSDEAAAAGQGAGAAGASREPPDQSLERDDSYRKAAAALAAAAVAAGTAAAAAVGAAAAMAMGEGAAEEPKNEATSPIAAAAAAASTERRGGEEEDDGDEVASAGKGGKKSKKKKKKKDKEKEKEEAIDGYDSGANTHVTFADDEKSDKEKRSLGKSFRVRKSSKKKKDKADDEDIDFAGLLSERRWKKRKKHQAKKDARKSYVKGKVIDREHELYTLSIAVMLGLRTSIAMTNAQLGQSGAAKAGGLSEAQTKTLSEIDDEKEDGSCMQKCRDGRPKQRYQGNRWLDGDDFMAVEKYMFRPKGTANTPPHQLSHTFKFKDYSPLAFAYLRRLFGVNEYEFLLSVCGNAGFIEFISNAKSGQFFFYSSDGKYMIKTMTNAESKFLRRILPHYFRHCSQNPNTLITKFLGMYRVKLYHLRRNVKFVIMNSVFDTDKYLQSFFDLKGSVTGRDAKPGESVKKDNDVRRGMPDEAFALPPSVRKKMREQVVKDCDFLREMKIMDYSMLVGVHHIPWRHGPHAVSGLGMASMSGGRPGMESGGLSFRGQGGGQHGGGGEGGPHVGHSRGMSGDSQRFSSINAAIGSSIRDAGGGGGGGSAGCGPFRNTHRSSASEPALQRIENAVLPDSCNDGRDMAGAMMGAGAAKRHFHKDANNAASGTTTGTGDSTAGAGGSGSIAGGSAAGGEGGSRPNLSPTYRSARDVASAVPVVGNETGAAGAAAAPASSSAQPPPTHRRAFDSASLPPGELGGSMADAPSAASYSTLDHYFDEDDDYSYLEGAYTRKRMDGSMDEFGSINFGGAGASASVLHGGDPDELYPRQPPDALEIKKEEATEQMYWPFHRYYDIYGQRRWLPLMVPEADADSNGNSNAESSAEAAPLRSHESPLISCMTGICCPPPDERMGQEGDAKWPLKAFERPVSNRKDGGLMMDTTGLELPLKLPIGGGGGGGASSAVKTRPYEGKIFYMGIIDVLQQFNVRKRFEAKYRRLRGSGWQDASCVHPDLYAERFIQFFDEYSQRKGPSNKEVEPSDDGGGDGDADEGVEEVVFQREDETEPSAFESSANMNNASTAGVGGNGKDKGTSDAPLDTETKKTK